MKTVFLLFDSLNRLMLEPYGCEYLKTPNFLRLAEKSVTFDTHYVGSMPCMPARRDMQTGRHAFLHRSWGPMEPFDNSFRSLPDSKTMPYPPFPGFPFAAPSVYMTTLMLFFLLFLK